MRSMTPDTIHRRRWWTLAVLCLALVIVSLDNTILNVALPTLQKDLNASASQLQWIVDAYMLVFAGLLLSAGSVADRFGRRLSLVAGLLVFGGGSAASAFAGSSSELIASRSVMGIGGALIMPATLSLITSVFRDPKERAKAIAAWSGAAGLAVAVGPVAGGALLRHFWWGSVFLVNIPIVALVLAAAFFLVPESRDPKQSRLDPIGALLSTAGLSAVVWAIIEGPSRGWTDTRILELGGVGIGLLAAFVAWERIAPSPMLDLALFRNRRFSAASLSVTAVFFALMGTIFFLTQYLQDVLHYSALSAGVRIVPVSIGMIAGAGIATKLNDRLGTKLVVTAGLTIVGAGLGILSFAAVDSGYSLIAASLSVIGLGMGLTMAPATDSIMGAVPAAKASVGSAVNDTTRMVGGTLGVAILGSVLSSGYRARVDLSALHGAAAHAAHDRVQGALAVAGKLGGERGQQLAGSASHAFVHAMDTTVLVGMGFALAGALLAAILLPSRASEPAAAEDVDAELAETGRPRQSRDLPSRPGVTASGLRPGARA
jgi:MFS transporter, DHA2 family, multidrug resistance protein